MRRGRAEQLTHGQGAAQRQPGSQHRAEELHAVLGMWGVVKRQFSS